MPNVYGFRSAQPRALPYVHPFTGAVIATPVLDLSSVRGPQGYADRSPTGAHGVPVGAPTNTRGVYDEAIKFGGVRDTLNCGSNAPLDIAGDISFFCWVCDMLPGALNVLAIKTNNVVGWYMSLNASGRPQVYFYVGGVSVGGGAGAIIATARWAHVGFTVAGAVARVFADGLEFARGVVTMSDDSASLLYIGSANAGGFWLNGAVELVQEYGGILSSEQIYRKYLEAKNAPIYYDTFESYAVTPVARAAGSMCGPFRVRAGTYSVAVDAAGQKWVACAAVGDCYKQSELAYGTYEFDFYRTATSIDQVLFIATVPGPYNVSAAQNGYMLYFPAAGNINAYRIVASAPVDYFSSAVGTLQLNTKYTIKIVRRVGGQTTVYLKGGVYPDFSLPTSFVSGTDPFTENTNTTSKYFCVVSSIAGNSISNIKQIIPCERPASFPWEFLSGTYAGVVSGSTIWMRCLTAGVTFIPKDLDWQTCVLKIYKGADANVLDFLFVASEIGGTTFANQNGYCLRMSADERLQLIRMDAGVETLIVQTAAAFVAITTEYEIKIQHNGTTNAYDFLIRGGAYADWTSTGLAATLGIHVSSNYVIHDLDANDRVTAPQFYGDLR